MADRLTIYLADFCAQEALEFPVSPIPDECALARSYYGALRLAEVGMASAARRLAQADHARKAGDMDNMAADCAGAARHAQAALVAQRDAGDLRRRLVSILA